MTKVTLAVGCRSDLWLYLTGTWAFMPKINRTSLFCSSDTTDRIILYSCGKDNEYIYIYITMQTSKWSVMEE